MKAWEQNILNRWSNFTNVEKYGCNPAFVATEVLDLLTNIIETGNCKLTRKQEGILYGFEVNTGFTVDDGFNFIHCLDLHLVSIESQKSTLISEIDEYCMEKVKVDGISFFDMMYA